MDRKYKFGALAIVAVLPLLIAAQGGFPSRPIFQRVTIGNAGAVLTNSGTSLLVNGVAVGAFNGAVVNKSSSQSVTQASGMQVIAYNTELIDTNNYHDNVTLNSRILLPSATGRAMCSATVSTSPGQWTLSAGTGQLYDANAYICVNGAGLCSGSSARAFSLMMAYYIPINSPASNFANSKVSMITQPMSVTPGDYAEVAVNYTGAYSTAASVFADSPNTTAVQRFACWAI